MKTMLYHAHIMSNVTDILTQYTRKERQGISTQVWQVYWVQALLFLGE
jgi:hypothetical protein